MPLLKRTLATLRMAELGFFGVAVKTLTQTPLLKDELYFTGLFFKVLKLKAKAGRLDGFLAFFLGFLIN